MKPDQVSNDVQHRAETGGPESPDRGSEKRLARGLEDVSDLFLSQAMEGTQAAKPESGRGVQEPSIPKTAPPAFVMAPCPSSALNRDQLAAVLSKNAGALEDGMRTVDLNLQCDPYSPIDLLALDVANRLAIVDFDTNANDGMLLRAICHFDWLVRNLRIVCRMYPGHVINASSPPRIILVAPQFPPMLSVAAHRMMGPQVNCIRYRCLTVPNGIGIFFESV